MVLFQLLFTMYIVYCFWAIRYMQNMIKVKLGYLHNPDMVLLSQGPNSARYDIASAPMLELYFGICVLMPIRIILGLILFLVVLLGLKILWLVFGVTQKNYLEPKPLLYKVIVRFWLKFLPRAIMFLTCGVFYIDEQKISIQEVLPNHPKSNDSKQAPLLISNHVSLLDMFYYMTIKEDPGLLAADRTQTTPVIGMCAMAKQCLFIKREEKGQRDQTLNQIRDRCKLFRDNENIKPLVIFPEGTIGDGKYMLRFKKGAFVDQSLIKIYGLRYSSKINITQNTVTDLQSVIFMLCQFQNSLKTIEIEEPLDCQWVLDQAGLEKTEENWVELARVASEVICYVSGSKATECSFREKQDFDKKLNPEIWGNVL